MSKGYGRFWVEGKNVSAHRWALERALKRSLAANHQACHHCDKPSCVNPAHLFEGTHKDNMADRNAKGRQARRERGGNVKLTETTVAKLRAEYAGGGHSQKALGIYYGIKQAQVSRIIRGVHWS
jgi:hypothetical protein